MSIFAPKLEVVISVIQFQFSSSIKKLKLPPFYMYSLLEKTLL